MNKLPKKYTHLRPPIKCLDKSYSPKETYTELNDEDRPCIRTIYYSTQYIEKELQRISEIERLLKKDNINLPSWWRKGDTLRFIHEYSWHNKTIIKIIKQHVKWLKKIINFKLEDQTRELLEYGAVYQLGRDKEFRPIVVFDMSRINDWNSDGKYAIEALCHILVLVTEKMLMPHHLENWLFIMDISSYEIHALGDVFEAISNAISSHFPQTLKKVLLVNSSNLKGFESLLNSIPGGDLKEKIINLDNVSDLMKYVDSDQLESKFGGTLSDDEPYWPPRRTLPKKGLVSRKIAKKRGLFFFQLHEKDVFKSVMPSTDKFDHGSFMGDDEESMRKSSTMNRPSFKKSSLIGHRQTTSNMNKNGPPNFAMNLNEPRSKSFIPNSLTTPMSSSRNRSNSGHQNDPLKSSHLGGNIEKSNTNFRRSNLPGYSKANKPLDEEHKSILMESFRPGSQAPFQDQGYNHQPKKRPRESRNQFRIDEQPNEGALNRNSFGGKSSAYAVEIQKLNMGTYNNGQYTKSYNPKIYNDNYRHKTIGFGKKKNIEEHEKKKHQLLNHLTFWQILGCNGR